MAPYSKNFDDSDLAAAVAVVAATPDLKSLV